MLGDPASIEQLCEGGLSLKSAARQTLLGRLYADESGISAIEYGLLSCIVAVVLVTFAASGMSPGDFFRRLGHVAEVLTGNTSDSVETPVDPAR